jgi:thioesterase domain-containing protein
MEGAVLGALARIREWMAEEGGPPAPLVIVTKRAVAAAEDEDVPNLALAPIWGLVRSLQHELVGRTLFLVDVDEDPASLAAIPRALASGEPQLAIRRGRARVPRLVPVGRNTETSPSWGVPGAILMTGGTGALGTLVARHLVHRHGARDLVLLSRRGPHAEGALALRRDLEAQGARVSIESCDVSDRDALAQCLSRIEAERPLAAVIHLAGVLEDGTLGALTPESLARVCAPKLGAALALHDLTKDKPLRAFVLFSSFAGIAGSAGQANYAAANAGLDALAHHRRARGLPGLSIAWGFWADRGTMTSHLDDAALGRIGRLGLQPIASDEGLALFDRALASELAVVAPIRLDRRVLGARPASSPRVDLGELSSLPAEERIEALARLVRDEAALQIGLSGADGLRLDVSLLELGMNSLMAIEIRKRLSTALGIAVPATLLFEFPTPRRAAEKLVAALPFASRAAVAESRALGLAGIVRDAHATGAFERGWQIVSMAAEIRAAREAGQGGTPRPMRLAMGPARPRLLCLPALAVPTGAVQLARFAAAVPAEREVWVLPNPGFAPGEGLPVDENALVACQRDATLSCAGTEPFAMLGVSSGGWVAQAVAERLEREGAALAAVVLLDTYLPSALPPALLRAFERAWMERFPEIPRLDEELTAMAWYPRLFASWTPTRLRAPTLLVQCSELLPESEARDFEWASKWPLPHETVRVPGDHMTMMDRSAGATARAVHDWLRKVVGGKQG